MKQFPNRAVFEGWYYATHFDGPLSVVISGKRVQIGGSEVYEPTNETGLYNIPQDTYYSILMGF